jgi:flavin-dependent dehydrogenase
MTLTVKVAVAGAGVGGLCLAQGLLKAGLEVTLYERDQALDAGGQGYRRIAPDARLSPARSSLMWAVTGAARQFAGRRGHLGGLSPADLHAAAAHAIRRAAHRRTRGRRSR